MILILENDKDQSNDKDLPFSDLSAELHSATKSIFLLQSLENAIYFYKEYVLSR